ncbi:hypothetical protein HanRHA438_Chr13g0604811 [Helianthus annuus]|uniref:Uncharacterized protein n=1 Tax=Helianthus annuus TaxID=4232 RepID=A0A9K3HCE2_HELAN|nr:hypothetical protein HanXRQr2_Chr13g0594101 [Helianthus annuus]KAJ0481766.1 hypothetical protein HanIR_Chr13g0646351 [Helianthus annuus]KAJ0849718.1 hypothetical protein HanPSC8_Chr13g0572141 [Helianthus annuus]KAJ0858764.1 hypothetical protein HanRHA438_Chr13g0604811 [Helianthus annuus]
MNLDPVNFNYKLLQQTSVKKKKTLKHHKQSFVQINPPSTGKPHVSSTVAGTFKSNGRITF